MTFSVLSLLFPVVLAIHNLDEYSRYDDFVRTSFLLQQTKLRKLITRRVIRDAAILLTLGAAVLAAVTYVDKGAVPVAISKTAILALLLNGIGHCVLSLKRRTVVPGTLSAATLVLPYAALAIFTMRSECGDSFQLLLRYATLGALMAPLAVLLFLSISYCLSRVTTRSEEPWRSRR